MRKLGNIPFVKIKGIITLKRKFSLLTISDSKLDLELTEEIDLNILTIKSTHKFTH
jgi:hypothetical protein